MLLLQERMGAKKGRRVRKMEVSTDTTTEFEFGVTTADIQRRRGGGGVREREEGAQKQREKAMGEDTTHSAGEGVAKKHTRTNRNKTKMDTETGGDASMLHSRQKKGHMTNMYLMDSDDETIVDFAKDHKDLYDKINKHFNGKARKECLWERFANNCKLFGKVCKTCLNPKGPPHTSSHSTCLVRLQKK